MLDLFSSPSGGDQFISMYALDCNHIKTMFSSPFGGDQFISVINVRLKDVTKGFRLLLAEISLYPHRTGYAKLKRTAFSSPSGGDQFISVRN